jgi:uncharacterized protein YjbJ (UPF0337 family)
MSHNEQAPSETPATWENVVVGKVKEVLGKATKDEALVEEGEEQEQIAHELRAEHHDH